MSGHWWIWLPVGLAAIAIAWGALVVGLVVAGRREDARVLARFIPDCVVLLSRLLRDERVPRRRKLLLAGLVGYLALPFDLVPDFLPVIGYADDVVVVVWTLRSVVRVVGLSELRRHWRGTDDGFEALRKVAGLPG